MTTSHFFRTRVVDLIGIWLLFSSHRSVQLFHGNDAQRYAVDGRATPPPRGRLVYLCAQYLTRVCTNSPFSLVRSWSVRNFETRTGSSDTNPKLHWLRSSCSIRPKIWSVLCFLETLKNPRPVLLHRLTRPTSFPSLDLDERANCVSSSSFHPRAQNRRDGKFSGETVQRRR